MELINGPVPKFREWKDKRVTGDIIISRSDPLKNISRLGCFFVIFHIVYICTIVEMKNKSLQLNGKVVSITGEIIKILWTDPPLYEV